MYQSRLKFLHKCSPLTYQLGCNTVIITIEMHHLNFKLVTIRSTIRISESCLLSTISCQGFVVGQAAASHTPGVSYLGDNELA